MTFLHGIQGWSDTLLYGMAFFALRATILLLAAWGVVRLLRNGSAASRHLVWTSTLAGILVLPLLSASVPTIPLVNVRVSVDAPVEAAAPALVADELLPPSLENEPGPATTRAPDRSMQPTGVAPAAAPPPASADIRAGSASAASTVSLTPIFAVAWGVIALLLLARLAVANARVSAWERAARPVQDLSWLALLGKLTRQYDIKRPVVLLESPDTDVPVTWGVVYPVILVPAEDSWDDEQRIAVLTHELAHVKRFDAFTQQLAQTTLALLWFHPLVWMAVRRMRLEREHACDDFVLSSGARASRYADDLLGLARRLARPVAPAAAALAMARRSELEGRLLSILDPHVKRTAVRRARVGLLTLGVIALSLPLAAFGPSFDVTTVSDARPAIVEPREPMEPRAPTPVASTTPSSDASPRASASALPSPRLADLRAIEPRLLDARVPEPLTPIRAEKAERLIQTLRARPDTEPQRPVEVQTLIDVTKHLKRMTSDYDKGVLLRQVAKRYVRNDELRDAYLDAVASMTSDHERSQALIALLERDSLPATSTARVLRATALMTSDVNRAMVLKRITPATFSDTLVQRTYVEVLNGMTSSTERSAAIAALLKQPDLTQSHRLALLRATSGISSNTDKANVLMLFLDKQGLADAAVRSAFYKAAATLTSDYDYRRVMAAVLQ